MRCDKCCFCVEAVEFYLCSIWNATIYEPTACKGCHRGVNLMDYIIYRWRIFKIFLIGILLFSLTSSAHATMFTFENKSDETITAFIYHLDNPDCRGCLSNYIAADIKAGNSYVGKYDYPGNHYAIRIESKKGSPKTWLIDVEHAYRVIATAYKDKFDLIKIYKRGL